jgi:hypothetical protein
MHLVEIVVSDESLPECDPLVVVLGVDEGVLDGVRDGIFEMIDFPKTTWHLEYFFTN